MQTRRFSNHESRLLSRSHTFAIIVIFNRFENTSKYVDTLTLFSKNLNQRSLTPRWPLTPCLLRSHVWLYPRIIVSKSHDDTSMYVDTVINFANYHIHTYTYYVHTTYILHTTYYVQNEWSHSLLLNSVQARQKKLTFGKGFRFLIESGFELKSNLGDDSVLFLELWFRFRNWTLRLRLFSCEFGLLIILLAPTLV